MIRKPWHAQLHRRKIWKSLSPVKKIWYFMKPFMLHFIMIWIQPFPMPTILKLCYTVCLFAFIMFPIIYPGSIFLFIYWIIQTVGEKDFGFDFPSNLDLRGYVDQIVNLDPQGQYSVAVYFYFARLKIMLATIVSLVDYLRLATNAILGV